MEEFLGRYRNLSVLLAVVFAQIILLGYQVRTDSGSSLLREWTVRSIAPVTKSVRGLTQWASSTWHDYFWLIGTEKDNRVLRHQLAQLKLENSELRSNLARFEREEKLVDYQHGLASQTILAQVIGKGANSNSKEIFISRGLDAGVMAGMPVITPDGIVGKVQASYPSAALVMLISDPEAGVGVLLGRSRAAGILKGTGHAQCRLDYVGHEVDVAIGEPVYTSGDDRVFPKGLRIGEVTQLGRGTDFQEIQVKPSAALDRLEEVLVINKGVHQDLPESPQAQAPQYLMPLPKAAEPARPLQTPNPAEVGPVQDPATAELESNGRLTDADRLRQYYQSVAEQQGHRIGYGEPGTKPPDFNAERLRARQAAGLAVPAAGPSTPAGTRLQTGSQPSPVPVETVPGTGASPTPPRPQTSDPAAPGAQTTPLRTPSPAPPAAVNLGIVAPATASPAKPARSTPPGWLMPSQPSTPASLPVPAPNAAVPTASSMSPEPAPARTSRPPAGQGAAPSGRAVGDPGAAPDPAIGTSGARGTASGDAGPLGNGSQGAGNTQEKTETPRGSEDASAGSPAGHGDSKPPQQP